MMKTNYLFPNRYKKLGWLLFIPGITLGILYLIHKETIDFFDMNIIGITSQPGVFKDYEFFSISENNILDELSSFLLIIGAILIAFSKEKSEDEFISKTRLESLVWATYVNYGILLLATLLVHGVPYFWVLVFNMFTLLAFFLIRFNWAMNKSKKQLSDEE